MDNSTIGLTSSAASQLLDSGGANAIADVAQHPLLRALTKLWAPVPWMLEAAIVLQLMMGDYSEAAVVSMLLFFNAGLSFYQEGRAQATLNALKSRLALNATVRRDGNWVTIGAVGLVSGDVIKLSLGAVVPADACLINGSVLLDQSMLTGESVPIEAITGAEAYAGALIRRGEAMAVVTATGERTKFGQTAELISSAKVESSQQKTILHVVRNLVFFNGVITIALVTYAIWLPLPYSEIVPLMLVAILSSIPVALPSMFTLAAAVGARALAAKGVLPTRLSAVDEAAGIDILCSDKTGTLTRNQLTVMKVYPVSTYDEAHILALASLASSDAGQDPVDSAICLAAAGKVISDAPSLLKFTPFDPALKRSEASVRQTNGITLRIVKGAFATLTHLSQQPTSVTDTVDKLQTKGYRVLAVAVGTDDMLKIVGLIALSDPPRDDSAAMITELNQLGVRTIMVTGDAATTANVVAASVGISGAIWSTTPLPDCLQVGDYAIFAGVLPEDKFALVKALQKDGHLVGMCGDGANDAPALSQAQMGIAVATATDVAKSAAGVVLTEAGLTGIVTLIKEGRITFQRILTYTLRSIIHKVVQVLLLAVGLVMTGHAILTPSLMVLMMVTGDFLAMSSSTDNVRPSSQPNRWRIRNLTIAGVILGMIDLLYCVICLTIGTYMLGLSTDMLRSFTVITLVFGGQAVFYVARERHHFWNSCPGRWLLLSSLIDLSLISILALNGILMPALPASVMLGLLIAAITFAFVLDAIKMLLFRHLTVA